MVAAVKKEEEEKEEGWDAEPRTERLLDLRTVCAQSQRRCAQQ